LDVTHAITSSGGSQKAALDALHHAILATQTDLNAYLTERKLEEDHTNGVNGTSQKRKAKDDEEDAEEDGDEDVNEDEE
jgi:Gon7 family